MTKNTSLSIIIYKWTKYSNQRIEWLNTYKSKSTLWETQIRSKNTQVENEEDGQWYFTQMEIERKPGSSTYTEQTLK